MKRLLITICGRAGSKGFKNKNLKNFCGKPLVYYSLSAAELFIKNHTELEVDIALNTDSEDLAKLVAAEYPDCGSRGIRIHTRARRSAPSRTATSSISSSPRGSALSGPEPWSHRHES